MADRIEAMQLGLAGRLLGHARGVLAEAGSGVRSGLGPLAAQLADALDDALLIAESRWVRLAPEDEDEGKGEEKEGKEEGGEGFGVADASCVLSVPGDDLASGAVARRFVREVAGVWGLPSGATDELELVAGELVANALEHTVSRFVGVELTRSDDGRAAGVRVTDEGPGDDGDVREGEPDGDEGGRGLVIVDALAKRWGWLRAGKGHTVWAEIAVDPAGAGASTGSGCPVPRDDRAASVTGRSRE
ncbi:ATP-binding protein [Streptomyces sp. NPDC101150]|uniref:ATP-binding protein n=1 Tax=Streptomyces sp. NPDC101150 TaxID=3366114 RepID=UPI0038244DD6